MTATEVIQVPTPRGGRAEFECRQGTSDGTIVRLVCGRDEYGLADIPIGTMVDVGAHIGGATIAAAVDNPAAQVVAVEPVPANADLLRRNIIRNGLRGRVRVYQAAAAASWEGAMASIGYGYEDDEGGHYYVGNLRDRGYDHLVTAPTLTLAALTHDLGDGTVDLLKIDCEGCEWGVLTDDDIARVTYIVGEIHGRTPMTLDGMLRETHTVTMNDDGYRFLAVRR